MILFYACIFYHKLLTTTQHIMSSSSMSSYATSTISSFEHSSKTPTYTVYEITADGHVMTSNFLSKTLAIDFSHEFTSKTSQVYVFKTKCIKVFDSSIIDTNGLKILAQAAEYISNYDTHDGEYDYGDDGEVVEDDDCEYLPENDEASPDETVNSIEIGDFEGLIFEDYGRGYMLRSSANSYEHFYGEPYLLDGWWIDSQEGWFFKTEYFDQLIEYGATYVKAKPTKSATKAAKSVAKSANSIEIGDFGGLIFEDYGRGYMLRPADDMTSFYGEPYLLNGWWIDSQEGWFFKKEHFDQLIEYGATYATSATIKTKTVSSRRRTKAGVSKAKRSLTFSDDETSPFTKQMDLSEFAITDYGKGLMVTCVSTNPLVKRKEPYLLGNLGFWNTTSKGWFFKMEYLSALEKLGATHIKTEFSMSEDDVEVTQYTDDTEYPVFEKYDKGYILRENSVYNYRTLGKYFEGGVWIRLKNGWFFKEDVMNAFLAKC